ncbi:MAG: aspartate kinase [Candidatus Kapabacteria bacterium]|nr:aspartate kinase [Candidatus Kapabacteria bacterium]
MNVLVKNERQSYGGCRFCASGMCSLTYSFSPNAIFAPMTVEKFGGAVLKSLEGFNAMASIIRSRVSEPCLVVVSAVGSTTRDLATAANRSVLGAGGEASSILDAVESHHLELARAIAPDSVHGRELVHSITEVVSSVRRLCRSVEVTRQCSARTLDRIIAAGEDLSRQLAVATLRTAGMVAHDVDARSLIATDDEFGKARPNTLQTRQRVKMALGSRDAVTVTQGFVASTMTGETTTMGRESSNLSASLLAACVEATSVTIWTDVPGVQTADPSICHSARGIEHLSYEQARIAANYGLKLLYPTMIEPAQHDGIPVRIASAADPSQRGTLIDARPGNAPVMIVSSETGSTTSVTMLFVTLPLALKAIANAVDRLGSTLPSGTIDIVTHMHDQAASIVVPSLHAPEITKILHAELCETQL